MTKDEVQHYFSYAHGDLLWKVKVSKKVMVGQKAGSLNNYGYLTVGFKNSNTTSKWKGVYWNKRDEKWMARIKINKRTKFLGYFKDEDSAALAYDQAARNYFNQFAHCNINNAKGAQDVTPAPL